MMRFGQTLFAGAPSTGLVTAAGVALCLAMAVGSQEVTRYAGGVGGCVALGAENSLRSATAAPGAANCSAGVSGAAVGTFSKAGLAQAVSSLSGGGARLDANGYGTAQCSAGALGLPYRQVRSYPYHAGATAVVSAEPVTYQLGHAAPALGTATVFGTTYYVGYGAAQAEASIVGIPKQETGGYGQGLASVQWVAQALYTLGAQTDAWATATLFGDAAVIKAGVRQFEVFGDAVAGAQAVVNTLSVYQSQTGNAYAAIVGNPLYTIGGAGHAMAVATAEAEGLAASTTVAGVPGRVTATATGAALVNFNARGGALAVASGGTAEEALVKNTRAYGAVATARALGTALARRAEVGAGRAKAYGAVTGLPARNITAIGTACAYAAAINGGVVLDVRGAYSDVRAEAVAVAQKGLVASGDALAVATAVGYNQVNDLLRAPEERTVVVGASARRLDVEAQDRRLTV